MGGKVLSTNQFIAMAISIRGNKYSCGKVYYVNMRTDVHIICDEHESFYQKTGSHIQGSGCFRCGLESSRKDLRKTTGQFIQQARQVHGDLFDYSKVVYVNIKKVSIKCNKHGVFTKIPNAHIIQKQGCPKCLNTGYSKISIHFLNDLAKEWKVEIQHA